MSGAMSGAVPSVFNGGLIDQHDGNIIPDRIEAMTLQAAQTAAIGFEFQVSPAGRADEDLEQFRTDRHSVEDISLPRVAEFSLSESRLLLSGDTEISP